MQAENDGHPVPEAESPDWKTEVRELRRVVELALILCDSLLQAEDSSSMHWDAQRSPGRSVSAFDLANMEKLHIQRVLHYTQGNKVKAAKLLNIGLTTIYRKLEEYGLE